MNKLGRQLNLCRRRLKLFLWLLALFILTACRKEPTTWDIQAKVPIAHTIIKATNLMSDSLISENADGYLSLVYTPQLLSIQKLEAFSFPDSLLTYNLPITVSGTLNPNTIFCNYNQLLNLKVNSAAL